jgi:hypothetical protein
MTVTVTELSRRWLVGLVALAVAAFALAVPHSAHAAGWCLSGESGVDRLPDVPAGAEVHVVYAIPSDGPDNFAQVVQRIEDDVTRVDGWWRAQDPTRTPRFDLAPSGACTDLGALDVSSIRLTRTSAQLAADTFLGVIGGIPVASGLSLHAKRYLIYYDGPVHDPDVCGVGSGGRFAKDGGSAIVLMQACAGVQTAVSAAHELLHSFGALPTGAPHACPGDRGHPCDSDQDILYPRATGATLEQLRLDVNHDDYYAHSGSWFDVQDSALLRHLDASSATLGVTFSGTGTVASDLPGLECSAACTTSWDAGTVLDLIAEGVDGVSRFVRWEGACTGANDCELLVNGGSTATAVFGPLRVPVRVGVSGRGRVVCTPRCSTRFSAGTTLTLRAVAATGWRFAGWTGACRGKSATCRPATDFAVSARAVFGRR